MSLDNLKSYQIHVFDVLEHFKTQYKYLISSKEQFILLSFIKLHKIDKEG